MGLRLRLLLIRDCISFGALLSVFYLPDPYGVITLLLALAVVAPRFQKAIRETSELQPKEKHIYVVFNVALVGVLIGLLSRWALRHPNSRASAIALAAGLALTLIFFITVRQVYGTWPPKWMRSDQPKFIFVVACVTLLALACEWLLHLASQQASAFSHGLVNFVPPFLLIGLMYFLVLRLRERFFPTLTWIRMLAIMFVFACMFIAVVVSL
jgi:hypothetical protein